MATRTCSYWFEPASCSAGGSRQEAFINKEAYEEWQSKVVAAFYEEGSRCTELFPQTGAPSVLRKRKFILYAWRILERRPFGRVEVRGSAREDLPDDVPCGLSNA